MTKVIEIQEIHKHIDIEDLPGEIWKDINGFEGMYQDSSLGRIKGLDRPMNNKIGRFSLKKGHVISLCRLSKDYIGCLLHKNNVKKTVRVSRIVAIHFIPNPENKPEVNHKWGNKWDNRACALEWSTTSENCLHAHANGLRVAPKGEKHNMAKMTELKILEIRKLIDNGISVKQVSEIYGLARGTVYGIKTKRLWKHV